MKLRLASSAVLAAAVIAVNGWVAEANEPSVYGHASTPHSNESRTVERETRAWLRERERRQIEVNSNNAKVDLGFRFTDELESSGIRFRHKIVNDVGKTNKASHYDHGNGMAVADVDGDGHHDLYFVTQRGANELWRNRGNGTFENITDLAGVAVADRVSVAASFADTDNDGDADLYVTTVKMGNLLFENVGGGRFRDISKASGTEYTGHSSGSLFFDYDNDGLLDLFVANIGTYTKEKKRCFVGHER